MSNLLNDVARCAGVGSDVEGWREGCEDCMRRTSPAGEWTPWMEPPAIMRFGARTGLSHEPLRHRRS